ncbi:MAG: protein kinase domain-containing protein [bacterium]
MARAQTLADLLAERRVLSSPELEHIFVSILDDLSNAHSQGRLHGDIKPKKIVQVEDGVWRLIDYGVSKVGTARYIAPEKAQKKNVDARSDLYSLGVVLYEAATGRPPFQAEIGGEVIKAHIEQLPPAPRSFKPQISAELENIILKAMAKKPEERFQTASDFRAALLALIPKESEKKLVQEPLEQFPRDGVKTPSAAPPVSSPKPVVPRGVMAPGRPVSVPKATSTYSPVATSQKRHRSPVLLIVLAVFLVGVVVIWRLIGSGVSLVSDVIGMHYEEAKKKLEDAGFRVELGGDKDDTFALGKVAEQLPSGGVKFKKGGVVRLRLSTGVIPVPDVSGVIEAEARRLLSSAGFDNLTVVREYSDQHRPGVVLGTEPESGVKLKPHVAVKLKVVAGRATCPVCGAKREAGARFCTRCGYRFED